MSSKTNLIKKPIQDIINFLQTIDENSDFLGYEEKIKKLLKPLENYSNLIEPVFLINYLSIFETLLSAALNLHSLNASFRYFNFFKHSVNKIIPIIIESENYIDDYQIEKFNNSIDPVKYHLNNIASLQISIISKKIIDGALKALNNPQKNLVEFLSSFGLMAFYQKNLDGDIKTAINKVLQFLAAFYLSSDSNRNTLQNLLEKLSYNLSCAADPNNEILKRDENFKIIDEIIDQNQNFINEISSTHPFTTLQIHFLEKIISKFKTPINYDAFNALYSGNDSVLGQLIVFQHHYVKNEVLYLLFGSIKKILLKIRDFPHKLSDSDKAVLFENLSMMCQSLKELIQIAPDGEKVLQNTSQSLNNIIENFNQHYRDSLSFLNSKKLN
jgi:hypothetical protein